MDKELEQDLEKLKNPQRAKISQRFFKTGKGEYGEGDIFIGLTVPQTRIIAKKYKKMELDGIQELIDSKIHEHRLLGLLILVDKYQKENGNKLSQSRLYDFYMKNSKKVNNWDLVDLSAHYIVGHYLDDEKDKTIIYKFARSENLWERRIAIISTFYQIRNKKYEEMLKVSEMLLNDQHDLIHKAVGWMLREVGKRDQKVEENFLKKHYKKMPRTMLRYAIERFEEGKRRAYLNGTI
ncbi:DNA alkylation repair protein [Candidatus Micrarchaeota archaeon]|nr:DNA alkylation repair protein [Candidatus Micrarchaeota archaeon]